MLGLTTHIANNNLKSVGLLLAFPLLLLTLLGGIFLVMGFFASPAGMAQVPTALFQQFSLPVPITMPATPVDLAAAAIQNWWPYVLGVAALWTLIGFFFNSLMIRAATGARSVTQNEEPELYRLLENLCISRGLKMPKLAVIESNALNAFASGIDEASYTITVTRGLMQTLTRDEMEAVLAHELTHIINRDVRLLIITVVLVGMISFIAEMLWRNMRLAAYSGGNRNRGGGAIMFMLVAAVMLGIGYLLALILRFAISRKREYLADAGAVELTKNPIAMISALEKISGNAEIPSVPPEVKQMFIENPPEMGLFSLFATHPPIADRIAVLRQIGGLPDDGRSIIPDVK